MSVFVYAQCVMCDVLYVRTNVTVCKEREEERVSERVILYVREER